MWLLLRTSLKKDDDLVKNGLVLLVKGIDRITEMLGINLAWLNVMMVLCMFLVVLLRYLFNHSSIPLQEAVMYLHAALFMLGSGFALKHDDHVRVDIFYQRMSPRARAWVNLMGTLLMLFPVVGFISWYSLSYVESAWRIRENSQEADGLPWVYLLKTLIFGLTGSLFFQGIAEAARNLCLILAIPVPTIAKEEEALS